MSAARGPASNGASNSASSGASSGAAGGAAGGALLAMPNRLASGGLVDRSRPLSFRFDGRELAGFRGDTLASALLASGVRLVGRSFKYHRPRGVLTAGSEEPNALVELRTGARREPNTRATTVELHGGLEATSQNRWPSLGFDLGAFNSLSAPLFPSGFYYKTFMWPGPWWEKLYEPVLRRFGGLGRANPQPDPDRYEKMHAFCDVLVVGAGPSGLAAALAAGRAGVRVILCDEDSLPGGRLNAERFEIEGVRGCEWAASVVAEIEAMPNVRVLRRTTVFGAYDGGTHGAVERVSDHLAVPDAHTVRQRYWKIVARRVVLASGAIERPIVFERNDLPGVMQAGAVRAYVNRFGVTPGQRVLVFTSTDDGWRTAIDLADSGVAVEAIVDPRAAPAHAMASAAQQRGLRAMQGSYVQRAHGGQAVDGATLVDADGRKHRVPCDTIAVSGGWNPTLALSTHHGSRPRWSAELSTFVPTTPPPGMSVAGAANGTLSLAGALRDGWSAGADAAGAAGRTAPPTPAWNVADEPAGVSACWSVPGAKDAKSFVDFQHDVTAADVALAAREGYRSVEHFKRYTTLGMATDQGKTSSINGYAIMAALTSREIPDVGTTTYRPPYTPVAIGALAGAHGAEHFRPERRTSTHDWAKARNAPFVPAGPWSRAQWYPLAGETHWTQSVAREVEAVRTSCGVCDVSTLGKIDVQGRDAGAFLDRVYINGFSTLAVGRVRYGLMLREDGYAMDDGTCARFADDHYVMSTTTVNAGKVMQHLEHARQVLWPSLDVQLVSVTEQWTQLAIAGPKSRDLLQRVLGDAIALSNEAFPYMACAEFSWRGMTARLFRLSFSGELAYELAVPARVGEAVMRAIVDAGAVPYGTEALGVLRIEKGHPAGNELNGTTTAGDLGFAKLMSTKKDFIGRVLATRPGLVAADRPVLVGVRALDPSVRLGGGAHFLRVGAPADAAHDEGYLTSTAWSPTLGHAIGLGFLVNGSTRTGERIRAWDAIRGTDTLVEVVSPVFVDPEGARVRG